MEPILVRGWWLIARAADHKSETPTRYETTLDWQYGVTQNRKVWLDTESRPVGYCDSCKGTVYISLACHMKARHPERVAPHRLNKPRTG